MVRNPTLSYRILRYIMENGSDEQRQFVVWVLERERIRRGIGGVRCR